MRKQQLHAIALMLIWIGGLEICASFLAKYWFSFQIALTPLFFMALLVGIGLYVTARVL